MINLTIPERCDNCRRWAEGSHRGFCTQLKAFTLPDNCCVHFIPTREAREQAVAELQKMAAELSTRL